MPNDQDVIEREVNINLPPNGLLKIVHERVGGNETYSSTFAYGPLTFYCDSPNKLTDYIEHFKEIREKTKQALPVDPDFSAVREGELTVHRNGVEFSAVYGGFGVRFDGVQMLLVDHFGEVFNALQTAQDAIDEWMQQPTPT